MHNYLEIYFLVFIIYSVLGWLMECTISLVNKHKLINRGFLIGPYCPIYGIGVVGVTLVLSKFVEQMKGFWGLIAIFLVSMILCGILEYFTSYIMEKLFHARWWDYSQKKFNINGRVCPETLIPFGFLSVAILKITNPIIFKFLYELPENVIMYSSLTFAIILIIDVCISYKIISSFKHLNKIEKDNTEEISKKVRETAEATIAKLTAQKDLLAKFVGKSKLHKRLISAFPNVKQREYTRKGKKDDK